MEHGFPLFDPNSESDIQSQKLKEYYESFSANARLRLLSKTIIKPTSVYDVLYPQTRTEQLSKNAVIIGDLEEESRLIRDKMVSRVVSEETDLEKTSKDFRDSLLARTKIHDDKNDLLEDSEAFRKSNIYNYNKLSNLEKNSKLIRETNLSKNKKDLSFSRHENGDEFRNLNTSKNISKDMDMLRDSSDFKKNNVAKNKRDSPKEENSSERFRALNVSRNVEKDFDLDKSSKSYRDSSVSRNDKSKLNSIVDSTPFRYVNLAKNTSKDIDLSRDSEYFRSESLKSNKTNVSDIEIESTAFRKTSLSKNKSSYFDQDKYSGFFRSRNLSLNESKNIDLDRDSESLRGSAVSKNKNKESSLGEDSHYLRKNNLSKNNLRKTDLDSDSIPFRVIELSRNKSSDSDLEEGSKQLRNDMLASSKVIYNDLLDVSKSFRAKGVSKNSPREIDLDKDSLVFRDNAMSLNSFKSSDLESESSVYRHGNTSLNSPLFTNLEVDSIPFRVINKSKNKSTYTNLEEDSILFRDNVLSFNSQSATDLEIDSVPFRDNVLAFNSGVLTDLETDSIPFRDSVLSSNLPFYSDLEVDSIPFRDGALSSNSPFDGDLETDSVPFRDNVLSSNLPSGFDLEVASKDFRDNNISFNSQNHSDLISDSTDFRNDSLASNVPSYSDLEQDSIPFRENILSSNAFGGSDLEIDSKGYREKSVSKNSGFGLIGVNMQGAGTSSFLGVSRVFVQGALIRTMLMSKNKPKRMDLEGDTHVFRENNIQRNEWRVSDKEYGSTPLNWDLSRISQGKKKTDLVDFSIFDKYGTPTANSILTTDDYVKSKGVDLQNLYGISRRKDFPTERKERRISDAVYYVNPLSDRGGGFEGASISVNTWSTYREGSITSMIRDYNQERNTFNLRGLQSGNPGTVSELKGLSNDGFQDLIKSTIGNFRGGGQTRTLTTPEDIIQKNNGSYRKASNSGSDISRPGGEFAKLGSAESMMAKTVPGNPYDDEDFFTGKRGVKHVINTIKEGGGDLAKNYDPQNSKAYLIGINRDKTPKIARQKYTIANPHAPGKAGKLLFSIKNYSSGDQFFFPPYIQSIQNTDSANWNSVNFLGRPEVMYTYNNSSRSATIVFHVLTDYAEKVDIGRNWSKDDAPVVTSSFDMHFTDSDVAQNKQRRLEQEKLRKLQDEIGEKINTINEKKLANSIEQNTAGSPDDEVKYNFLTDFSPTSTLDSFININTNREKRSQSERDEMFQETNSSGGSSELEKEKSDLIKQLGDLSEAIGNSMESLNRETNYSESSDSSGNVYGVNMSKREYNGREIISKPEDTIVRIDTMKKGLMFQPAYFSGDKIDFVRRIEFLSKLTRPAAASEQENTGFSFTKPPICHIRLGDWWNHDIAVNSVSYDYNEAPWTLDEGRVQPMWVTVSIDFNIIGPYGSATGRPPLSTDNGGMYSPMK